MMRFVICAALVISSVMGEAQDFPAGTLPLSNQDETGAAPNNAGGLDSFYQRYLNNQARAGTVPGRFSYVINSVHPAPEQSQPQLRNQDPAAPVEQGLANPVESNQVAPENYLNYYPYSGLGYLNNPLLYGAYGGYAGYGGYGGFYNPYAAFGRYRSAGYPGYAGLGYPGYGYAGLGYPGFGAAAPFGDASTGSGPNAEE